MISLLLLLTTVHTLLISADAVKTPFTDLAECLGQYLSSSLYSPTSNPGSGFVSYNWLKTSVNDRVSKNPAAVLLLPNISFVSKAVKCAAMSGIQPVVRSGGHSSEGSSSLDNKLVIDLSYCNNLISIFESPVGSGNYQAKFEAGMKLGQIYSTLFNNGQWTIAGGVCPYVGAGGHLTGGGMGMLTRQFGLGTDQLTAVDIVLADGRSVTTDSTSYSDLFWALRGGGGASFGVVTHFTANLFKVPTSSMFFLKFSCNSEILNLWQTFFVTAPNEVNAQLIISVDDSNINGQYVGPMTGPNGLQTLFANAGILTMKTLIWSQFTTCSGISARAYVVGGLDCSTEQLNLLNTVPIEPNPREKTKAKSDNFNALIPISVLDTVANMLRSNPNTVIYGHSLGGDGLFATQPPDATPFADRSAWHTLEYHFESAAAVPYYPGSASYTWLHTISDLLSPYTTGYKYLNYQDFDLHFYYGVQYWGWDNFQRLIQVKNKYDPTNFFNNPQSIPLSINYTSFTPTISPTSQPNNQPTAEPSSPTFMSTTAPTARSLPICLYGGFCKSDSECVPGSTCQGNLQSYTQCQLVAVTKTIQCVENYNGCSGLAPCCNPGFLCTYSQCVPTTECIKPLGFSTGVPTCIPSTFKPTAKTTITPSAISSIQPSSIGPTELPTYIESTELPTFINISIDPSVTPTTTSPTQLPSSFQPSSVSTETPSTINPSIQPTISPSNTSPTIISSAIPTQILPSITPTSAPTIKPSSTSPKQKPSAFPSNRPTFKPSKNPTTAAPSKKPSSTLPTNKRPTVLPSLYPTKVNPTAVPTTIPTITAVPTILPTIKPSTVMPTAVPTSGPTIQPSTINPTAVPTKLPTINPSTVMPTASLKPTVAPSKGPTTKPSTLKPTVASSKGPTTKPSTLKPTVAPSRRPTTKPSSVMPTAGPSRRPTTKPSSVMPTAAPSRRPTTKPSTLKPTASPTKVSSSHPTSLQPK